MPERAHATRRLLAVARFAIPLLILAWVATKVPWKDELTYLDGQGTEHMVQGRIEGNWKEDQVRFFPRDPAEIDAAWPADAHDRAFRDEPIVATRRGEQESTGFD